MPNEITEIVGHGPLPGRRVSAVRHYNRLQERRPHWPLQRARGLLTTPRGVLQ